MGGKAFSNLGEDAFPRIPPMTYKQLKAEVSTRLKMLFQYVETPAEAPEKTSHGDVDFLVAHAHAGATNEDVKLAINATHAIVMEGNRTSNYAIASDEPGKYYQIDIHICEDKEELERTVFFHGYGDLGMILGLLARAQGLSLGTKGLKIVTPCADEAQPASFHLSSSFADILPFFGLSMDDWKKGFTTRQQIFEWITTSRFFIPRRMSDPRKREKTLLDREMYQMFLEFSHNLHDSGAYDLQRPSLDKQSVMHEALLYFKKKDDYENIIRANRRRIALKKAFSGSRVMEWTGLQGICIRHIMKQVRSEYSEDDILNMDEVTLRAVVLRAQLLVELVD